MSLAAALLDRLGRPGDIRLGTPHPEALGRLPTGLALLDAALGGGLPRGRISARAAERTRSSLLVVAPRRSAGTHAVVGLELTARRVRWNAGPGRLLLLEGVDSRITIARSRVGRPGRTLLVSQAAA